MPTSRDNTVSLKRRIISTSLYERNETMEKESSPRSSDMTRRPTLGEEAAAMKAACEALRGAGSKPGDGFDDVDDQGGIGRVRTLSLAEQARQARESCERDRAEGRDAGPTLYRGDER